MRALILVLAVASCAHGVARVIHRDQQGGVVELGSGRDDGDRAKAARLMSEVCSPSRAVVVEEGEEVTGYDTKFFHAYGVGRARSREETAYRLHFECRR